MAIRRSNLKKKINNMENIKDEKLNIGIMELRGIQMSAPLKKQVFENLTRALPSPFYPNYQRPTPSPWTASFFIGRVAYYGVFASLFFGFLGGGIVFAA